MKRHGMNDFAPRPFDGPKPSAVGLFQGSHEIASFRDSQKRSLGKTLHDFFDQVQRLAELHDPHEEPVEDISSGFAAAPFQDKGEEVEAS
jgi:hypothetical protein